MTREFLERYQGILADIAAIKADKVTDTVSASSPEFPYSQHTDSAGRPSRLALPAAFRAVPGQSPD